jgi:hypothetical protein
MRSTIKVAITILVVAALATTGVALALDDDAGTDPAATEPAGDDERVERIVAALEPLIEDGTITLDQAEAVAEVLDAHRPMHRRGGHGPGHGIDEVAEFLGMTVEEILTALRGGSTLAGLATDAGSSADELIAFMVEQAEERLDQAVADGRLTEDERAEHLAEIEERFTEMVNGEFPGPGGPGMGRRGGPGNGRGFHHGPGGDATDA